MSNTIAPIIVEQSITQAEVSAVANQSISQTSLALSLLKDCGFVTEEKVRKPKVRPGRIPMLIQPTELLVASLAQKAEWQTAVKIFELTKLLNLNRQQVISLAINRMYEDSV